MASCGPLSATSKLSHYAKHVIFVFLFYDIYDDLNSILNQFFVTLFTSYDLLYLTFFSIQIFLLQRVLVLRERFHIPVKAGTPHPIFGQSLFIRWNVEETIGKME